MLAASIPVKMPTVWAAGSSPPYNPRTIPQTSTDPNAASWELGYPPNTQTSIASGGVPLNAQDVQAINQQITEWLQWQQAGVFMPYDATFQTAIGGYFDGAIVASVATPGAYWRSTADNNLTNPDASGAGWVSFFAAANTYAAAQAAAAQAAAEAAAIFQDKFTSAPQNLIGSTISVAHSLGAQPFGWQAALVCITPNAGFNAGDQVLLPATTYTGAGGGNASYMGVWANATSVGMNVNNVALISAGGGTNQYITPGDWNVIFRAWL